MRRIMSGKQVLSGLLTTVCLLLLLGLLTVRASAAEPVASGTCGDGDGTNLTWTLDSEGTLTISGTGPMKSYYSSSMPPWYSYQSDLKALVIKSGVTCIGERAFQNCAGFSGNLVIPDSVITIGSSAFSGCTGFTGDLVIPDSVTEINNSAFSGCTGFTGDLVIPDSVTEISNSAFSGCTGFSGGLTISDHVAHIGQRAFENCSGFKGKLTIGSGTVTIGSYAFSGCSGFTGSLTIPDGVMTIADHAFYGCKGFGGGLIVPASVTYIYDYAFYECSGLSGVYFRGNRPRQIYTRSYPESSVLHYIPGMSGWPTGDTYMSGYELATWDGYRQITTAIAEKFPAGKYGILVLDNAGLPIQGAAVTFGSETNTTDKNGLAVFDAFTIGQPSITVTCAGYRDWSNTNTNYTKSADGYDIVILYTEEESELTLAHAYYTTTTEGEKALSAIDLLSKTKRLSMSSKNGTFTLTCEAMDVSSATGYALYQGSSVIQYNTAGVFDLSIRKFSEGGDVFVRVYGGSERVVDTPINLSFVDDATNEYENSINLGGDKLSLTVNKDYPFVGGSELTFDIPALPLDIVYSEDTVHVGINVKLNQNSISEDFEEGLEDIKKTMDQLKDLRGINVNKNLQKQLDAFTSFHEMNVPVAGKVKANFIGYGEGKLDEAGLAEVKVDLYILVKASVTVQGPTYVVVVVPVTFSIKVGVDGKLGTSASYDLQTSTLNGDVKFTLTPNLEAFGGVGVGKLVGAGAFGSANLPIEIQLIGTSQTPGVNYIDLTGSLGLKAYVSIFEYKKDFAYSTWHIYTHTAHTASAYTLQSESWLAGLYDENAYTAADLSYLAGESGWLDSGISPVNLDGDTTGASQLTPLQTGTYRNMQPVLGSADGTPVLVWVRANMERGAYDYPQLVYSCFTGGSWTEPQPVDADNLTADAAPTLATAPDGTLYLAYQSSAQPMTESGTLADYAASQTIVIARFDGEAGKFTDFVTVSEDGVFSRSPVITAAGGTPLVAWVSNSDSSDYFMQNSTGSICCAQLVNGVWQRSVLAENCSTVTDLAAGLLGGQPTVAALLDGDADLTTTGDSVLWCYPLTGAAAPVASGDIGGINLAQLPGSGSDALLWFSDTALYSYDGAATATVFETGAAPSGFTVLSDRILFNAASGEENSNLYAFVYSDGRWSDAVQVTAQGSYLQSYAASEISGTTYLTAVQADVTISDGAVEENCTLAWGILDGVTDLAVYALSVDHSQETPGGALPISVDIQNLGDRTVNAFTVTITDASGTTVGEQSFLLPLAPAEVETVSLDMTLSGTVTTQEYTVTVSAAGDQNTDNDSAGLTAGLGDLSVSASLVQVGDSSRVMLRVVNNGAASMGGQMIIRCGSETLQQVQLATLAQGESSLYEVEITREALGGGLSGIICAELTPDSMDSSSFNDHAEVFVALPYTESVEIQSVSAEGVALRVQNAKNAYVGVALYAENGQLLLVSGQELAAEAGEVTIPLDAAALSNAAQVKAFLLDSSGRPLLPCAQTGGL